MKEKLVIILFLLFLFNTNKNYALIDSKNNIKWQNLGLEIGFRKLLFHVNLKQGNIIGNIDLYGDKPYYGIYYQIGIIRFHLNKSYYDNMTLVIDADYQLWKGFNIDILNETYRVTTIIDEYSASIDLNLGALINTLHFVKLNFGPNIGISYYDIKLIEVYKNDIKNKAYQYITNALSSANLNGQKGGDLFINVFSGVELIFENGFNLGFTVNVGISLILSDIASSYFKKNNIDGSLGCSKREVSLMVGYYF